MFNKKRGHKAPKETLMLHDIAISLGSLVVVTVSALYAVHHLR